MSSLRTLDKWVGIWIVPVLPKDRWWWQHTLGAELQPARSQVLACISQTLRDPPLLPQPLKSRVLESIPRGQRVSAQPSSNLMLTTSHWLGCADWSSFPRLDWVGLYIFTLGIDDCRRESWDLEKALICMQILPFTRLRHLASVVRRTQSSDLPDNEARSLSLQLLGE